LTVGMTCAAPEGCDGKVTLKSGKLRIAQIDAGPLASGASRTDKVTLAASRVRHLQRHHVKALRAVVAPTKGAQAVSQLSRARWRRPASRSRAEAIAVRPSSRAWSAAVVAPWRLSAFARS